jgi:hypothetical protein
VGEIDYNDAEIDALINREVTSERSYNNENNYDFKQNILANFPQTKFYMPTLRDGYTRFIPI